MGAVSSLKASILYTPRENHTSNPLSILADVAASASVQNTSRVDDGADFRVSPSDIAGPMLMHGENNVALSDGAMESSYHVHAEGNQHPHSCV